MFVLYCPTPSQLIISHNSLNNGRQKRFRNLHSSGTRYFIKLRAHSIILLEPRVLIFHLLHQPRPLLPRRPRPRCLRRVRPRELGTSLRTPAFPAAMGRYSYKTFFVGNKVSYNIYQYVLLQLSVFHPWPNSGEPTPDAHLQVLLLI